MKLLNLLLLIKFRIADFEYTPECIVFDLLHIPLYHGWLVEQNSTEAKIIGNCSYNQLVDKIISNKTSSQSELVAEGNFSVWNVKIPILTVF